MIFFLFLIRSSLVPAEWGAEMIVTNTSLSGTWVSWVMGMVWCSRWSWEHPDCLFLPGARWLCAGVFCGGVPLPTHHYVQDRTAGPGELWQRWKKRSGFPGFPLLGWAVAAQDSPWDETALGTGPTHSQLCPPCFSILAGWCRRRAWWGELQWCRTSLSLSHCCTGIGMLSGCYTGLFYKLLLYKLERAWALN